jgi:uncharacterized protein
MSSRNANGWWRTAWIGAVIIIAVGASVIWLVFDRRRELTTELIAADGTFIVEIARTPEARANGLARRTTTNHDGLLLVWDEPARHPIWMADMRFALDLIWLDARGHVLALLANVPPCDRQPCSLHEPPGTDRSTAVLEMPAGRAASYRITVGSSIDARGVKVFVQ